MPLYEFKCRKCGHLFERLVRAGGDLPGTCPKCGARRPEKLFSAFSAGGDSKRSAESCPTGTCPFAQD